MKTQKWCCLLKRYVPAILSIGLGGVFTQNALAFEIEEVIVTAQKRAQDLQDVPLSVSAMSGDRIKEMGFANAQEMASHTPGLSWEGTAKSKPNLFLRGVGNSDFQTGSRSPVAFYLDGVYMGSTFGLSTLLTDAERVEVLRGPQGTLWGKNTTAGLINFVTVKAKPGEEANGYVETAIGSYGQKKYEGAVGFSLSEDLAVRLMLAHDGNDGVFKNSGPDFTGETGGGESDGARINFVYEPSDRLSLDLMAYTSETDGEATPAKSLGIRDPSNPSVSCPFSDPGELGTSCSDQAGFVNSSDLHEVFQNFKSQEDTESSGAAFTVNYDFEDFALTSITAYNEGQRVLHKDNDSSTSILSEANQDDNFNGWSQELRLASSDSDDMQWLLGFFYYEDNLDYFRSTVRNIPTAAARLQDVDTETGAVFGEISYDVVEELTLTLGLRWTYDKREAVASGFFYNVDPSFPGTSKRLSRNDALINISSVNFLEQLEDENWSEFSGKLALQYRFNEDVNIWASVARGFKGGDPNSGAFGQAEEFNISDPEFLTSYEAGVKSKLFDNALQVNASVYYYDYEDKQVFTEVDGGAIVGNLSQLSNAGALTISGVDLELAWSPGENWYFQSTVAYINSEFDEFQQVSRGNITDFAGNTTALTPKLSFSGVARYEQPLSAGGIAYIQSSIIWKDDQFFTNENDDQVSQESYSLVSASAGWKSEDERWDVSIWGKNITDEEYFVHGFSLGFRGTILNNIGDPSKYGATVRYRF